MDTDGTDLKVPGQGMENPFYLGIRVHPCESVANSGRMIHEQ